IFLQKNFFKKNQNFLKKFSKQVDVKLCIENNSRVRERRELNYSQNARPAPKRGASPVRFVFLHAANVKRRAESPIEYLLKGITGTNVISGKPFLKNLFIYLLRS
ncbi:MAG: hypothetical protein II596_03185, partial [Thermoguttaceae bacterium]|nr:hypothetical protein [Thermoguttaceae bacterium]